jgi:hypothetical protein
MLSGFLQGLAALLAIVSSFWELLKGLRRNKNSLSKHSILQHLDYWILVFVNNIPIDSPRKKKYIRQFLKIKLSIFKKNILNWIKINEKEDSFDTLVQDIVLNSIEECRKECLINKIPQILIEKMEAWNDSNLTVLVSALQDISKSQFYQKSMDKKIAILDVLLAVMHIDMISAENGINTINGKLEEALQALEANQ